MCCVQNRLRRREKKVQNSKQRTNKITIGRDDVNLIALLVIKALVVESSTIDSGCFQPRNSILRGKMTRRDHYLTNMSESLCFDVCCIIPGGNNQRCSGERGPEMVEAP